MFQPCYLLPGGLVLCVQDLALCEEAENSAPKASEDVPPSPTPVSTNIGEWSLSYVIKYLNKIMIREKMRKNSSGDNVSISLIKRKVAIKLFQLSIKVKIH